MANKTPKKSSNKETAAPAPLMSHVSVTVTGPPHEVRRMLTQMAFTAGDWNQSVARTIALDETQVADATLQDTLGGDRIGLFAQDARDLYRQRCVNNAGSRGHAVPSPNQIPDDATTTIMEVGDALFKNALP